MERLRIILQLALCVSIMSGCQIREITPEERAEDERTVDELQSRVSQAFAARDSNALVSLYADNGALYYDDQPLNAERMLSGTHGKTILTSGTSS